jgi:hypothetical protein
MILSYGWRPLFVVAAIAAVALFSCSDNKRIPDDFRRVVIDTHPPVTPLSPEESIRLMQLPPGFEVQLVASEPMVQEPVGHGLGWQRAFICCRNEHLYEGR